LYFTDHEPDLGRQVSAGRRREFAAFPQFADPEQRERIPDPQAGSTFESSKLRWEERDAPEHRPSLELYRAALRLRQEDVVLSRSGRDGLRAEVFEDVLVVRRWYGSEVRLLLLSFGLRAAPLAPLAARFGLDRPRVVLASSPEPTTELRPGAALILAGKA
jgi:maltooligosyltrehalose trehalohydrolase